MQELWLVLALMVAYGVVHSLLATFGFKALVINVWGQRTYFGLYRLFFNFIATVMILPVLLIIWTRPGETIWQIEMPLSGGFTILQGVGLLGLTVSMLQIDAMRFLGIRQAAAWLNGDRLPLPPEPLQLTGVYRVVRHPLYLFSLLLIWPVSTMTAAWLGFSIASTAYFVVGSLLEEHKMRRVYGEVYQVYQEHVPWMVPFLKFNTPSGKRATASEQFPD